MKKIKLEIPIWIKKLSDGMSKGWALDQQLPCGDVIVNKVVCGCGLTTYYLENDLPVILASPRNELIVSKMNDERIKDNLFFFDRTEHETVELSETIKNMDDYLRQNTFNPKILVTNDSLGTVLTHLSNIGKLSKFTIVLDEFTVLLQDALLKGDTVFSVVQRLSSIPNRTIYVSATPLEEKHMEEIDEFRNLPYVTLVWDKSMIEKVSIKKQQMVSTHKAIGEIIEGYKHRGYFQRKIVGDTVFYSKEAAYFVNSVKTITDVVCKYKLSPDEVRIICAKDQEKESKAMKKLGLKVEHFPSKLEYKNKVKPHTFITKTAYVGSDYYSDSASIYIFADSNRDEMALDISLELPQIIGRCRSENNIFRHDVKYFYKTTSKNYISPDEMTKTEMEQIINQKYSDSERMYRKYANDPDGMKLINSTHEDRGFREHYLSVNNGRIRFNKIAHLAEKRAIDIKYDQYGSMNSVEGYIMKCGYDVQNANAVGDDIYAQFRRAWDNTHDFKKRMEIYLEMMNCAPDKTDKLKADGDISPKYWKYATILGPEVCKAKNYKEADLKKELEYKQSKPSIITELLCVLDPNHEYSNPEMKALLQWIYDKLGINQTAKAKDIEGYLATTIVDLPKDENGKRRKGYRVNLNTAVFGLPVSLFNGAASVIEGFDFSLGWVIQRIRTGKGPWDMNIADIIAEYRVTKSDKLKKKLPCVMWQGLFSERNDAGCRGLNSVMCLDLDHVPEDVLESLRLVLRNIPFVLAYFLSPSGEGLKVLVKTDMYDVAHYKNCYRQLMIWFQKNYELAPDSKCIPLSHTCFMSYDPDLYFNPNAQDFHFEYDPSLEKEENKNVNLANPIKVSSVLTPYQQFMNKFNIIRNGMSDEDIFKILDISFHTNPADYMDGTANDYYKEGNRERSIAIQATTLLEAGIPKQKALNYLIYNFRNTGFPQDELTAKVEYIYKKHEDRYGCARGNYKPVREYKKQRPTK